uniref:Uncharacterized protein n=1 Tax=Heterorhabditis bacteriophora TaxID=37862 RepID=A0A1I7WKT0_HETBA
MGFITLKFTTTLNTVFPPGTAKQRTSSFHECIYIYIRRWPCPGDQRHNIHFDACITKHVNSLKLAIMIYLNSKFLANEIIFAIFITNRTFIKTSIYNNKVNYEFTTDLLYPSNQLSQNHP